MVKIPLIENFKAFNVKNAFILSSIYSTLVLSLTFFIKDILKDILDYFNIKIHSTTHMLLSIFYIFIINILAFTIMYIVFDYGGGMLITN
jgi:hypothetical protein